jgi:hypothetical protein
MRESCNLFTMLYNVLENKEVDLCIIISIEEPYEKNLIHYFIINDCTGS